MNNEEHKTTAKEKAQMLSKWAINKNYKTFFKQNVDDSFQVDIEEFSINLTENEPIITLTSATTFYPNDIDEIVQKLIELYKDDKYAQSFSKIANEPNLYQLFLDIRTALKYKIDKSSTDLKRETWHKVYAKFMEVIKNS